MNKCLLRGRIVIGLAHLVLVGALCAWAPPVAAQKVTADEVQGWKDKVTTDTDAMGPAVKEAKDAKPSDKNVKDAEDKLDAAERTLADAPEGSQAARKAQKDVDAARKAADKAQDNAGEDASDYRSALRKIRGIRHRLLFAQKQLKRVSVRLGRQSSDTVLSNVVSGLETKIEQALDTTKTAGVAAAFGPDFGANTVLAGWSAYAGGNVAVGFSHNDYDRVLFDGAGPGAGGQIGFRYRFPSNWFVGAEFGAAAFAVNGNHHEGPFTDINWQLWQVVQVGYAGQAFGTPIAVHVGGGVTEARFTAGFDNGFFRDAMSDTVTGWLVRGGAEFGVTPNTSVGTVYQFSRFNGRVEHEPVKSDIHTVLITFNYNFPIGP